MEELQMRTIAAPMCVACGSAGKLQHEHLIDKLFGAPGVWNLRRCCNVGCGLGWLDPQPVRSEISKLYRNYWTHDSEEAIAAPTANRLTGATPKLKEVAARLFFWRRAAFRSDLRYLSDLPPGRLLDVGCGTGDFLATMAQRGWKSTGLDFDDQAVIAARKHAGVDILCGDLFDQQLPSDSFDAITLSNVIEHLPDPAETLSEIARILAPGGRLVIVTPNVDSTGHQNFGRYWRGLEPPRHLFLFSQIALQSMARGAGLRSCACFTAVGDHSILNASRMIWQESSNACRGPNIRLLIFMERLLTLFNIPVGEYLVLLGTK